MDKVKTMISLLLIMTFVLVGCGQSENNQAIDPNNSDTPGQTNEEKQASDDGSKGQDELDIEEEEEENHLKASEITLKYTLNNQSKSGIATKQHNDNQNYSMHVLPEYVFTAEEPNNDVVYVADNSSVFMRIQLLPNNVDWKYISTNTKEQLQTINSANIKNITAPTDFFYKDAEVLETTSNDTVVTAYLIKNHTVPLKLLMYTTKDADHRDAFLKMAETIVKDE